MMGEGKRCPSSSPRRLAAAASGPELLVSDFHTSHLRQPCLVLGDAPLPVLREPGGPSYTTAQSDRMAKRRPGAEDFCERFTLRKIMPGLARGSQDTVAPLGGLVYTESRTSAVHTEGCIVALISCGAFFVRPLVVVLLKQDYCTGSWIRAFWAQWAPDTM